MTAEQREIVRKAELAAMGPPDAIVLLAEVCGQIRGMVNAGDLHRADAVLAGMTSGTSRVVALALAGDLDKLIQEDSGKLADLLAQKEHEFVAARAREGERLDLARDEAEKISVAGNQRFRQKTFLRKMHEIRRCGDGGDGSW